MWQELSNMKISILICKQQGHSNCAPSCNDILQHQNAATPSQGVCRSYPGKDRLAGSYKLLLLMLLALILLPKLQALRHCCLCFGIGLHGLFLHSCMFSLHLLDVIGPTWTDLPSEQHCPLTAGCFHVDWHKLLSQQHNDGAATRADGPLWGRTLASAGMQRYAGNHQGMPYTIGQLLLNQCSSLP